MRARALAPWALLVLVVVVAGPSLASAGPPVQSPASAPAASGPASAPVAVAGQALERLLDQGLRDLGAGDYPAAAAVFDQVAAAAVDPRVRGGAEAIARYARSQGVPVTGPAVPGAAVDRSGRLPLVTISTLLGFAAYGPLLVYTVDSSSQRVSVGLYSLTAAASFLGPFLATRHGPVPQATATLGGFGAIFGLGHGALLDAMFSDGRWDRGMWGTMLGASLAEGIGGAWLVHETHMGDGTAHSILSGEAVGAGWGAGAGVLLGLDETREARRWLSTSAFVGSAAGAAGGAWLAERRGYTAGGADVLTWTLALGTYTAAVPLVLSSVSGDHHDLIVATLMAGSALGGAAGDWQVAGRDIPQTAAWFPILGSVAGGALAAGLTYIVAPSHMSSDTTAKLYVTSTAAGAIAGFVATWLAVDPTDSEEPHAGTQAAWSFAPFVGPHGQPGAAVAGAF